MWAAPFGGALLAYVASSAIFLGLRHPVRTVGAVVVAVAVCSPSFRINLDALEHELDRFSQMLTGGRWGLDFALTGGIAALSEEVDLPGAGLGGPVGARCRPRADGRPRSPSGSAGRCSRWRSRSAGTGSADGSPPATFLHRNSTALFIAPARRTGRQSGAMLHPHPKASTIMLTQCVPVRSSILALAAAIAAPALAQPAAPPRRASRRSAPAASRRPPAKPRTGQPDGIVVTGTRADVIATPDRVSFSVTDDLQVQTGTLADALRAVPGVEVDLQGRVSLRGDPDVTILIDGRPSAMLARRVRAATSCCRCPRAGSSGSR